MAGYSPTVYNVVHDACLTVFGYLPYLIQFDVFSMVKEKNQEQKLINLFEVPKQLPLPQNLTWGSFLPKENPTTNMREWEQNSIDFLKDVDGYLFNLSNKVLVSPANWSNANISNNAGPIMSELQKDFAETLNLCEAYDRIWPRVAANYKSMELGDTSCTPGFFERFNNALEQGKKIPYPDIHLHEVPEFRSDSML